jgi:tetratricopeptide (TPR) repeat protein
MATIGLCMIVKNEAHVLARCLEAVRPLLDFALIVDTGSSDGTQALARDWLERHGLRGDVVDMPWHDFAWNRTAALRRLREHPDVDYALTMDADDTLVLAPDFDVAAFKAGLAAASYSIEIRLGALRYWRPHLLSNRLDFKYRGVVHEFVVDPPDAGPAALAPGMYILAGTEGGRSRNPEKYREDAAALRRALAVETDPSMVARYTFYLAQSLRDAGDEEAALAEYLRRAEQGGWAEEVFVALLNAARLRAAALAPFEEVLRTYLRAHAASPNRAEALHGASLLCRNAARNEQGYELARRGLALRAPDAGLFVESWIYDWGLLDEFALNGYWAGHHRTALDAWMLMLASGKLPETERGRILDNARYALDKLAPSQAPPEASGS